MSPTFEYGVAHVESIGIELAERAGQEKPVVTQLTINGEGVQPTPRFWTSFFVRFGISENIFKYFDHAEVFQRIASRAKSDRLRYCLERDDVGHAQLLAVSNPERPLIEYDEVTTLTSKYAVCATTYHQGVVTTTHIPRAGDQTFDIHGDQFQHRFVMDTPIDGYGQPKIHLSFLRLLCSNGAIGYAQAFRSEIAAGKDIAYGLVRALDSFDNEEGYSALRQRFESAQRSWASVHECDTLYRQLAKLMSTGDLTAEHVFDRFHQLTGNLHSLYGLANFDALSVKRQRVLPAKCRVYDLVNFASELATHHAAACGQRLLQGYIGNLISDEYDLEGTADKMTEFRDFFVNENAESIEPRWN